MGGYEDTASSWLNASWISWVTPQAPSLRCCMSIPRGEDHELLRGPEKSYIHEQPSLVLPPVAQYPYGGGIRSAPVEKEEEKSGLGLLDRIRELTKDISTRSEFTVKRRLNTYNGSNRLQISGPTNFVHVSSGFHRQPEKKENFRPLELSIYKADRRLSPIMPDFSNELNSPIDGASLTVPPTAITTEMAADFELSQYGFSIPRKAVNTRLSISATTMVTRYSIDSLRPTTGRQSEWISQPLRPPPNWMDSSSTVDLLSALEKALPQLPPAARLKAEPQETKPVTRRENRIEQIERVQSALIENLELDRRLKEIDLVIQRQSLSFSRRSSQASHYERSGRDSPVPAVPPIPKIIPAPITPLSRFNTKAKKTKTARPRVNTNVRPATPKEARSSFENRLLSPSPEDDRNCWDRTADSPVSPRTKQPLDKEETVQKSPQSPMPPPPLPLILQQPPSLRRKKSFSLVSKWLMSTTTEVRKHSRSMSLDTVTNHPQPITARDGFYQTFDLTQRDSMASVTTYDSVLDEPMIPTNWTPESSPATADFKESRATMTRVRTFGPKSRRRSITVVLDLHSTTTTAVYDTKSVRLSYVDLAY